MKLQDWLFTFKCIGTSCFNETKKLIYSRDAKKPVGIGAGGDETIEFDRRLENIILKRVAAISNVRVLSEERGVIEYGTPTGTVIMDPLDGSINAKSDIPIFTTALAYSPSIEPTVADLQVAYVKSLTTGEEFYANRNRGAYRNCSRLRASLSTTLKMLSVELYPYPNLTKTLKVIAKATRIRSLGSITYDLCLVGSGAFDAFVDFRKRLRILDMAPAILIIKEAGGIVTDEYGRDAAEIGIDIKTRTSIIAAGNKKLHSLILDAIK